MSIYNIYKNIFSFVVKWFPECQCRHVDKFSGYNCRITLSLLNKTWITGIRLKLFILHYITSLYYIILHLTFILLLIYNSFKGSNDKVKLERSRQLDNYWRKTCERCWSLTWQHHPRFVFLWYAFSLGLCSCQG